MNYSISIHNGYHIISIGKQLSMLSTLDELKTVIGDLVAKRIKRIAIQFADASYLSSHSIATIIACNEMIHEVGGELMIVGGPADLESYLDTLGIKERFSFCKPTKEMLAMLG